MDEVSAFFKKGFESLHKKAIEKNYQQKTLRDRMTNFNNARRDTRNTLMLQKRNIDVQNLTPFDTPEPERILKKTVAPEKTNKRLEMLQKWKADKEKKRQEEKRKAKPIFKVCHVPMNVGLPDLEKVNKEIKGKPIKVPENSFRSQFAPQNHRFKPPKDVKPMNMINNSRVGYGVENRSTRTNQSLINSVGSGNRIQPQKSLGSIKTSAKIKTSLKTTQTKVKDTNATPARRSALKNTTQDKGNSPKVRKLSKKKYIPDKSMKTVQVQSHTPKKGLGWDIVKIIDSDDEVLTQEISTKSPKKIFSKTPTKRKNAKIDESNITGNLDKGKQFVKRRSHVQNISENHKQKNYDLGEEVIIKSVNSACYDSDSEIMQTRKLTSSTSFEDTPLKDDTVTQKSNVYSKATKKVNENLERRRSQKDKGKKNVTKTTNKIGVTKKQNISGSTRNNKEQDIIYSDDEITLKTPVKKRLSSKNDSLIQNMTNNTKPMCSSTPKILKGHSDQMSTDDSRSRPIVYVSPFVTISRGKDSARKEYKIRQSTGGTLPDTPEFQRLTNFTSPKAGAEYFSKRLDDEIDRIETICKEWMKYKETAIPEEANDLIDTAIGQSKLLIRKKFQQFRDLIIQCRDCQYKEKLVTCTDLHGFWDTMYMQVEDIDKRFNNLEKLKANGWEEVIPVKKVVIKRGKSRVKKTEATSKIREMIQSARARNGKNNRKTDDSNNLVSDQLSVEAPKLLNNTRSSRVSAIYEQANKRTSSSPGLTMMKITQAIKRGDGLTPSRSILKTDSTKSEKRMTKSVFFKDLDDVKGKLNFTVKEEEYKENDSNNANLISFSPITPIRRSRRLSKLN